MILDNFAMRLQRRLGSGDDNDDSSTDAGLLLAGGGKIDYGDKLVLAHQLAGIVVFKPGCAALVSIFLRSVM